MKLANKVAIVTGAGRGIGRAISIQFATNGAKLAIFSRNERELKETANLSKSQVFYKKVDARNNDDIISFINETHKKYGKIDILVNNAGIAKGALLVDTSLELWNEILSTNLNSVYYCTKAVLPYMIKQKSGRIINISSTAGKEGGAYISAYSASKFAVIGFTQSVAQEVSSYNITVNSICPGYINTKIFEDAVTNISKRTKATRNSIIEKLTAENAHGRIIEPEEVAKLASYLASDESQYLTGEAITLW